MAIADVVENFLLAEYEAEANTQNALTQKQISDAQTGMVDMNLESDIYSCWNNTLSADAANINNIVQNEGSDPSNATNNAITNAQTQYNTASTEAQSFETTMDGNVQSAQGQTSTDASNLQNFAQMLQGLNSIMSTLSNMLGQVVA